MPPSLVSAPVATMTAVPEPDVTKVPAKATLSASRTSPGAPGSLDAGRRHGEQRLAAELDPVQRENRLIRQHRPDVVAPRDIGRADYRHNFGRAPHGVEVEAEELRKGLGRHPDRRLQRPGRLGQIVDVARLARDVQRSAVVRQRLADHSLKIAVGEAPRANLRSRFCARVSRYHAEAR